MTKIEQLSARFPAEAHGQRQQGGRTLTYIGIDSTIQRLNEVFGLAYSTEILEVRFQGDFVMVWASLTYQDDEGKQQKKHGVGVDKLDARDPDKCVKTAYAEAIKKASHQLGVGLYLWDDKERAEVEREMRNPKPQTTTPSAPPPGNAMNLPIKLETIKDRSLYIMDSIKANGKKTAEVKAWCESQGIPASAAQMTDEQFIQVVTHIFNGKIVVAA